ncbi:ABC transporter permease [Thalassiella azotivora]
MSVLPAGTGALVRLVLRRDRVRLPLWVGSVVLVTGASAQAVQGVYDTQTERDAYAATVGGSPAAVVMSGPPTAVDTLGGITVFEVNLVALVGVALMGVFLVVRHTRAEEEQGRTELVRAGVVGRFAPVTAALLVVGSACLLVGAGVAASFAAFGLPASGSLLYGAVVAATGLVFTAVGVVAAQVSEHARPALGTSGALLGVAFLVRGFGDIGDGPWSWLSPIGWVQATRPFGDERWWPLLLALGLVAVLVALAGLLVARRDVGAGLLATRPGRPSASPLLTGPLSLALRLQRGSLAGWTAALLVLGLVYGSFAQEVGELVESNPVFQEVFGEGSGEAVVDGFFAYALLTTAVLSGAFAVSSALRLRSEETAGRAEALLTTGLSRTRWVLATLAVTLLGSVLTLAAAGAGMGVSHALTSGDSSRVGQLTAASLAYLPAVLVVTAVAVLLLGWLPRASLAAWAALVLCFVAGWLGPLLELPTWTLDVSPFEHVPAAPLEDLVAGPLLVLTALAAAGVAAGVVGVRRRDLTAA